MKHRGSSKIKYEHHMIKGLREFLEKIENWNEIKSLIPGVIRSVKSVKEFDFSVKYDTHTGVKCVAKSGSAVQEVFVVTSDPGAFKTHLESLRQ